MIVDKNLTPAQVFLQLQIESYLKPARAERPTSKHEDCTHKHMSYPLVFLLVVSTPTGSTLDKEVVCLHDITPMQDGLAIILETQG